MTRPARADLPRGPVNPSRKGVLLALVLLGSAFPGAAHAYLDPGTGSMMLQLLLGGLAGALMILKLYWKRIRQFFLARKTPSEED